MKTSLSSQNLCLGVVVAGLLWAQSSRADQLLTVPFDMPVKINALVEELGCDNSPDPQITLGGNLTLGGLKARITLSNNAKGTHESALVGQFDVDLFLGGTIVLPKQPVLGGVGGNPLIYLQFTDGKGGNLSGEYFLGPCVQGLSVNADLINKAVALATIQASDRSNHPGPYITLGGDIVLNGLHAKIIFRNNVTGTLTAVEDSHDITIISEGTPITIPKQPVLGGVGGNPLITIQLLHSDGTPVNDPVLLGRCVQL
jgi:hypothetical protein